VLEPLGEQAQPRPVPEHDLDEVGPPAPEHEEMAAEGIVPQPLEAFCARSRALPASDLARRATDEVRQSVEQGSDDLMN